MSNTQHVVVMRKDLQMPTGLVAAQTAHAAKKFMIERILTTPMNAMNRDMFGPEDGSERDWMKDPYIAVLAVQCLEELHIIRDKAREAKLQIHVWNDVISSPTFEGVSFRTDVGLSIGPDDADAIKLITGGLPLF